MYSANIEFFNLTWLPLTYEACQSVESRFTYTQGAPRLFSEPARTPAKCSYIVCQATSPCKFRRPCSGGAWRVWALGHRWKQSPHNCQKFQDRKWYIRSSNKFSVFTSASRSILPASRRGLLWIHHPLTDCCTVFCSVWLYISTIGEDSSDSEWKPLLETTSYSWWDLHYVFTERNQHLSNQNFNYTSWT